jgi:penicillin-binding protein 1A
VAKLFVYLAAFQGGMSPRSMVSDDALTLFARPVRNFDNRYLGPITIEAALARSSNTAAVRLATGNAGTIRTIAKRLGVTTELAGEAGDLALGTYEATLMEMTAAYAALANRGARVTPYAVLEIRDNAGERVFSRVAPVRQPVIPSQHVTEVRRMLAGVVTHGTGRSANPGVWAAGKTGTTTNHRDAWFIGFTDRYVAGVWLGNSSGSTGMTGVTGGGLPAQIWRSVITDAMNA